MASVIRPVDLIQPFHTPKPVNHQLCFVMVLYHTPALLPSVTGTAFQSSELPDKEINGEVFMVTALCRTFFSNFMCTHCWYSCIHENRHSPSQDSQLAPCLQDLDCTQGKQKVKKVRGKESRRMLLVVYLCPLPPNVRDLSIKDHDRNSQASHKLEMNSKINWRTFPTS